MGRLAAGYFPFLLRSSFMLRLILIVAILHRQEKHND